MDLRYEEINCESLYSRGGNVEENIVYQHVTELTRAREEDKASITDLILYKIAWKQKTLMLVFEDVVSKE